MRIAALVLLGAVCLTRLPIALPIGSMGNPLAADPSYVLETAKYEKEHPRSARNKTLPPPDPQRIAATLLERAGFRVSDLDAIDRNRPAAPSTTWRPQ